MANLGMSAQGTLIYRQAQGVGEFVVIGDLKDITPPPLTRNPLETTTHNEVEESFVVGIRRKGELTFGVNFIPSGTTHGQAAGLIHSWQNGYKDGWKIAFPDGTNWIFSGYVSNIAPSAPVDDVLTADITIRPTDTMSIT